MSDFYPGLICISIYGPEVRRRGLRGWLGGDHRRLTHLDGKFVRITKVLPGLHKVHFETLDGRWVGESVAEWGVWLDPASPLEQLAGAQG